LRIHVDGLRDRGITFVVAKAHLPLREAAIQLGLQEWFGERAHFAQLPDAVAAFLKPSADRRETATRPQAAQTVHLLLAALLDAPGVPGWGSHPLARRNGFANTAECAVSRVLATGT
jgi:hypothetical protein